MAEREAQRVLAEQAMLGDGDRIGVAVKRGGRIAFLVELGKALSEGRCRHPAAAEIHVRGNIESAGRGRARPRQRRPSGLSPTGWPCWALTMPLRFRPAQSAKSQDNRQLRSECCSRSAPAAIRSCWEGGSKVNHKAGCSGAGRPDAGAVKRQRFIGEAGITPAIGQPQETGLVEQRRFQCAVIVEALPLQIQIVSGVQRQDSR